MYAEGGYLSKDDEWRSQVFDRSKVPVSLIRCSGGVGALRAVTPPQLVSKRFCTECSIFLFFVLPCCWSHVVAEQAY